MYSEIASIVFFRICFFFCLIKQPRSPKSNKSQTIEEIVVYQPPADESRRWTSSNDRDSVDINTAIYIYICLQSKKHGTQNSKDFIYSILK